MIDYANADMYKVADNCLRIIRDTADRKNVPIYSLFSTIHGWTYDSASYYLRRNPLAINDKFINMMLENFNCSLDEIFKDTENKTNDNH